MQLAKSLALAALLIAVAGAVQAAAPSTAAPRVGRDVRIVGGTAAERQLLHSIVAGVQHPHIMVVRIGVPRRGWGYRGSSWLYVTTRGNDTRELVEGSWQTDVVGALYSDAAHKRGLRRAAGTSLYERLRDRPAVWDGSDAIDTWPMGSAGVPRLDSIFRHALRTTPFILRSLSFDRLLGQRVVITAELVLPRARGSRRYLDVNVERLNRPILAPDTGLPLAEGMFLTVRNRFGAAIYATEYAARLRGGVTWW